MRRMVVRSGGTLAALSCVSENRITESNVPVEANVPTQTPGASKRFPMVGQLAKQKAIRIAWRMSAIFKVHLLCELR